MYLLTILITILISAILALPIVVFVIGHQRKWSWAWRFSSLAPLITVIVIVYFLLRTPESFYHKEYKIITNTEFPESGEIQFSKVSPEAFNGDYTSVFIVELEPKDIRNLKQTLPTHGFTRSDEPYILDDYLDDIESEFGSRNYSDVFTSESTDTYMVGFLDDHKSVVLYHFVP